MTKHWKKIQNFKETNDLSIYITNYIYQNELEKGCFSHDAAYTDSKYLAKRTVLDKILKDISKEIAPNLKYDGYQRELASMVCRFFINKIKSGARATSNTGASGSSRVTHTTV